MTKDKALHAWFNSAIRMPGGEGYIPFYTSASVPEDAVFPWGTYELVTGAWGDGELGMTVNLWFYTEGEAAPNAAAAELAQKIGLGGVTIPCDEGVIWLKRGAPWCQSVRDETDANIKRRYINVTAEFFTLF